MECLLQFCFEWWIVNRQFINLNKLRLPLLVLLRKQRIQVPIPGQQNLKRMLWRGRQDWKVSQCLLSTRVLSAAEAPVDCPYWDL